MSQLHREVELRFKVADPEGLLARLEREGAQLIGAGTVDTIAFDYPDRRLRAARQMLRLRRDWTGTTLTGKLPLSNQTDEDAGRVRARDEINVALAPQAGDDARALLRSLGLIETLHYIKERQSWALDEARIDVDRLADGGDWFAEIEAEPDQIAIIRARIGLDLADVETRSYFDIVHQARSGR